MRVKDKFLEKTKLIILILCFSQNINAENLYEKIINNKTEKETSLTLLEKDILTLLIDQQEVEKNLLLEGVLKIKKETETKTIESHLTRIRNKLLKINSKLKITSKGNKVFLNFLL